MPEVFRENDIWDRKRWQKERDDKKYNVPKGAVSKVSIGDRLDKFHKANKKSVVDGAKAAAELKKDITTYKAGIKGKYQAFHDRIKNQLEYFVDIYIKEATVIVSAVPDYAKLREDASTKLLVFASEYVVWQKGGSQGQFAPSDKKGTMTALNEFLSCVQKMVYVSDKVKPAQATALDKLIYSIDGGAVNDKTIKKLVEAVKATPNRL
jgi:hypothetical protein